MIRAFILVILIVWSGSAYAVFDSYQYPALTNSGVNDVIDLLKFAQKAAPEDLEPFEESLKMVTYACYTETQDAAILNEIVAMQVQIDDVLPKTNGRLLKGIGAMAFFGGKDLKKPKFREEDAVRENVDKYIQRLRLSYAAQDYEECYRLVSFATDEMLNEYEIRFAQGR